MSAPPATPKQAPRVRYDILGGGLFLVGWLIERSVGAR